MQGRLFPGEVFSDRREIRGNSDVKMVSGAIIEDLKLKICRSDVVFLLDGESLKSKCRKNILIIFPLFVHLYLSVWTTTSFTDLF